MHNMDKNRFLNNVTIIEIENNSACNRACSYCINSHIYRKQENEFLLEDAYKRLIDELSLLGYSRIITFHRYNEPFLNQNEMILSRIKYAREKLPKAKLIASSNGDYIDSIYLRKIALSGLDELYLQCHVDDYSSLSVEDQKKMLSDLNEKIGGFPGKFEVKKEMVVYVLVRTPFKKLTIQIHDFINDGFDRGGILKSNREKIEGVCWGPLTTLTIDHNGSVMICCNCVSYFEPHMKYIIGNIYNSSILNIYNSRLAKKYQKALSEGRREEMCNYCTMNYARYRKIYNVDYLK